VPVAPALTVAVKVTDVPGATGVTGFAPSETVAAAFAKVTVVVTGADET
jgi:hypothetical protein